MREGTYVLSRAGSISAAVGEAGSPGRRLIDEFLRNPFLDDDAPGLALRTGLSREEAEEELDALRLEGYLRDAGRRGHALSLHQQTEPAERADGAPDLDSACGTSGCGAPACGCILMRADGRVELMDDQAAQLLCVDAAGFDGAAFEGLTGIDIGLVLSGGQHLTFTLQDPRPLLVSLHACSLGSASGVLVVVENAQAQSEVAAIHAQVQEELFARLRGEVAEPVLLIQQFLENPDAEGLGQARAALEQVNRFLDDYLLGGSCGSA